jgi:hypothetical protein
MTGEAKTAALERLESLIVMPMVANDERYGHTRVYE